MRIKRSSQKNLPVNGFTIVELLIVIVVIAILASIAIVAYNGVRERALDSKYATEANAVAKGAYTFNTINNNYPYGNSHGNFYTSFERSGITNMPSIRAYTNLATCEDVNADLGKTQFPSDCTGKEVLQWTARGKAYGIVACEPIVDVGGGVGYSAGIKVYYPSLVEDSNKIIEVGDTSNCASTVLDT